MTNIYLAIYLLDNSFDDRLEVSLAIKNSRDWFYFSMTLDYYIVISLYNNFCNFGILQIFFNRTIAQNHHSDRFFNAFLNFKGNLQLFTFGCDCPPDRSIQIIQVFCNQILGKLFRNNLNNICSIVLFFFCWLHMFRSNFFNNALFFILLFLILFLHQCRRRRL